MGSPTDWLDAAMSEAQSSYEAFTELSDNISFSLPEAEASAAPSAAAAAAEASDMGPTLDFLTAAYIDWQEQLLQQHRQQQHQPEQQLQQQQPPTPPWKKARLRSPVPPPRSSCESQPRLRSPVRPPSSWQPAPSSSSSQPAPSRRELRRHVSDEELLCLRAEQATATAMGLRWQERGPPPSALPEGQTTWKGQAYRPGTGKWANRGGVHKQWYTEYYKAKRAGPAAVEDFLAKNPNPKTGSG